MELKDLLDTYAYNPKEELKEIIIERIKLTKENEYNDIMDYLTNKSEIDDDSKYNYNEIKNDILNI